MKELRARQLLELLRGTRFDGVLNLNRQTYEILSKAGLNRTWVSQAANRLVKDGLAEGSIEQGSVRLRITEAGREASW